MSGPGVIHVKTGQKTALRKDGNVHVMDLWFRTPSESMNDAVASQMIDKGESMEAERHTMHRRDPNAMDVGALCAGSSRSQVRSLDFRRQGL